MFSEHIPLGDRPPRVQAIVDLGVVVGTEYEYRGEGEERKPYDLMDTVSGVTAPLDADEWASIAQREGDNYVGGCCGNMSAVQDEVNNVFRDGGWIDGHTLLRIGEGMRSHDGRDDPENPFRPLTDEEFEAEIEKFRATLGKPLKFPASKDLATTLGIEQGTMIVRTFGPWEKLAVVYAAVEPYLKVNSVDAPKRRYPHEIDDSHLVHQLDRTFSYWAWNDLLSPDRGDKGLGLSEKPQHEVNRRLNRAKALPLLKRMVELIEAEGTDWAGYALVHPESGEILSNYRGPCLYNLREEAQVVLDKYEEWNAEEKARKAKWAERGEAEFDEEEFDERHEGVIARAKFNEVTGEVETF